MDGSKMNGGQALMTGTPHLHFEEYTGAIGGATAQDVSFKSHAASDADVNSRLLAHGAATDTWSYQPLYEELVTWCARFNHAFFGGVLPPPAISLERGRALGTYTPWRDGLALKYRINISSKHLRRAKADVLRTLLHEMLHEWEEVELGRTRGGSYHSAAFWRRAKELGIPVRRRTGHSLGIAADGRFARLLAEHGLALDDARLAIDAGEDQGIPPTVAPPCARGRVAVRESGPRGVCTSRHPAALAGVRSSWPESGRVMLRVDGSRGGGGGESR